MTTATRPHPIRGRGSRASVVAGLLLAWLAATLVAQVVMADSAAAHAELVSTTPSNGERLDRSPARVTLEFTESVRLLDGGLKLLDANGETVPAPEPVVENGSVRWPMPASLPDGAYLVNWRVISGDGHPISGAFSFGVGVAPTAVPQTEAVSEVPWLVTVTRLGGYVGFTAVAGAVTFGALCWPAGRSNHRTRLLLRSGFVVALTSTVLALLVQGPYAMGEPMSRLLDREVLSMTSHSEFGIWTQLRLFLYLALAGVLWSADALEPKLNRWMAGIGIAAVAITHSGTGHAAASGRVVDRAVDAVHMLAAGVWLGGLVALALTATLRSGRPTMSAFAAFSRLALLLVLTLVATGTINGLLQLEALSQLWQSSYGQILATKVALVGLALSAAWFSRRRLHRAEEPWGTVRLEAAATLAVLAVTAVLASTSPPSTVARAAGSAAQRSAASTTVEMDLGEARQALLHIDGLGTSGSTLHLEVVDARGRALPVRDVKLRATLPTQDLGPLDVTLSPQRTDWVGRFRFPLSGTWSLTLTVEEPDLNAVVTTGEVEVG